VIVLDTHALVWWVSDPARLPASATRLLTDAVEAGDPIHVSSISAWEIAMLVARRRLAFTMDADVWLSKVEALPFLRFVPVDNRIAMRAVQLDDFPHRDPADRMIVATTIALGATLVTADDVLRSYERVKTTWD
jgi:PIN domain nuclease of toxin-antitoxin system